MRRGTARRAPTDNRRSIRLPGYDYTQAGAYFVTICAHERQCCFGNIENEQMRLNGMGEIVLAQWQQTAALRAHVLLGECVVMPNHFHGILILTEAATGDTASRALTSGVEQFGKPIAGSLPTLIRAFKSAVTKSINQYRDTPSAPVWQRNYYEHIIRNEADYRRIAEYVSDNPRRWAEDSLNPDRMVASTALDAGAAARGRGRDTARRAPTVGGGAKP